MYKERNFRKANFAVVILSFLAIALASYFVLGFLPIVQLAKDVALMAILVGFVLVFLKRWVSTYEYELTESEIILRTYFGETLKAQISADLDKIVCFCSSDDTQLQNYKCEKIRMFALGTGKYTAVFEIDGRYVKAEFAPSKQMVDMINKKIGFRRSQN
jgi:hypothetical protein